MKFRAIFKNPDALDYAVIDATEDKELRKELFDFTKTWVDAGEYVTIEFDTEAGTARVCEKQNKC